MAAAREIVVLSSSPPRTIPDSDIIVTPPCLRERFPSSPPSPDLPSLPDLLKSKSSGLKSGSRAAEIPNGATLGFGTVASLLKERQISLDEENDADLPEAPIEKKPPPKRTKAVRKPRTTPLALDEPAKSTKPAAEEEDKDGAKATKKSKAPKPRQSITKKTKVSDTAGKDGMGTTEDGSKHDAEAHRESSAVGALKKRRAKSTPEVSDPLSAQVRALATEDVLKITEPTVVADEFCHESELPKLQKSKGRSKKNEGVEPAETKSGKASKPRQKKTAPDEKKQAKKAPKARKATTAESAHFSRDNSQETAADPLHESPKSKPVDAPLDLDQAIERRRSWTPSKDTTSRAPIEISDSPSEPPVSSSQRANQNQFASLLGGFGYQKSPQRGTNVEGRAETGEAFTKRRKLEMIPNPVSSAAHATKKNESGPEKPTKAKAPVKKKPKTITELATAAYRAPPAETTIAVDTRVSEFFAPRPSDASSEKPDETRSAPPEKPKRARQKSPSKASIEKARKTTEKAKKEAKLAANKLLSPGAALLKYNDQEVLFGTSSQLVHEESPTFVRQIEQALKESEAASMKATSPETLGSKTVTEGGGLSLLGRRKGLWNAAARNLLDENLDVYDPGAEKCQAVGEDLGSPLPDTANGEAHASAQPQDSYPDFVDIDEYDDLTKRYSEISATVTNVDLPDQSPQPFLGPPVVQTRPLSSFTTYIPLHAAPRYTTLPLQRSYRPKQLSGARVISTSTADRGRPAGFVATRSTTDPSTRAARNGSKAPRLLPQGLISIPDALPPDARVPESRREGHVATRNELPQGLITPPKRPGRKKAKQDEEWIHIDEIENSEEEITPSPPRRRKVPSESPKLRLTTSGRNEDAASIPPAPRAASSKRVSSVPSEEQLAGVFPIITDAIKASPPSVHPKDPSWHERILLYDPVAVEDLSEWLNGRGVRIQMEVAVKVKKTKKKNASKTADAESGDEATAVQSERLEVKEVPLQPWIVQRWCEEHSICCFWKDNDKKRKGWKSRTG